MPLSGKAPGPIRRLLLLGDPASSGAPVPTAYRDPSPLQRLDMPVPPEYEAGGFPHDRQQQKQPCSARALPLPNRKGRIPAGAGARNGCFIRTSLLVVPDIRRIVRNAKSCWTAGRRRPCRYPFRSMQIRPQTLHRAFTMRRHIKRTSLESLHFFKNGI